MKCTICGEPVILSPSAKERAAKDVTGKSARYYTELFTTHATCAIREREEATLALIRRNQNTP